MFLFLFILFVIIVSIVMIKKFNFEDENVFAIATIIMGIFLIISAFNATNGIKQENKERLYNITGLMLQQEQNASLYGNFCLGVRLCI